MKKRLLALLLIFVLLVAVGCSNSNDEKEEESTVSSESTGEEQVGDEDDFKVALLLPGTVNDQGWNAKAYEGLMKIEEELGAEVAYSESVPASDYEEVFRGYASQGYDMVIGHGFEFGDAAIEVASDFEDVMFVVTSTDIYAEPNVCSLENLNIEQGFLAGVVAALMTETGIVGSVGGMEIPSIVAFNVGFEAGVNYINPEYEALTTYTGDFDDAAKAKEMASAMIANGADIVTHDADGAGLGVLEAAKEAGVYAIGSVGDQADIAPDTIITSAANVMSDAILLSAKLCKEGKLEPINYEFGVADDVIYLTEYRNFDDIVPEEVKQEIAEIEEAIKDGSLNVNDYVVE